MVGSFHVIMVQEAQSHHHEFNTGAEQQFHIYRGAGQLIFYNKDLEPEGEDPRRNPGHVHLQLLQPEIPFCLRQGSGDRRRRETARTQSSLRT